MKELLEKDAEFAEGCKRALATPDPTDAEWLASLNERGFSEQAFVEHYGAALAEEVQSQLSG